MMRRLASVLLIAWMPVWVAAAPTLTPATHAGVPPLDPADPAWAQAPAAHVLLYPQATAPDGPGGAPLPLEARVLRGGGQLAVRLAWADATENLANPRATDRFADAVAVEFAPPGKTLPYVGMGEPKKPVTLWLWRAGGNAERLAARGFGSLARQVGPLPDARARRSAEGWEIVLRGRPDGAPAALAFAAWDGADNGRAGRKYLSTWQALAPSGGALPAALREEARLGGDAARGARLFSERGCVGCHAPSVHVGPDLAYAGGIHWPGYLRRAVREPGAFLVPGYPAIMPALDLRPEEVEDLVAHLMSLR